MHLCLEYITFSILQDVSEAKPKKKTKSQKGKSSEKNEDSLVPDSKVKVQPLTFKVCTIIIIITAFSV